MNKNLESIVALAKECVSTGNTIRAKSLLQGAHKSFPNTSEVQRLLGVIEAISGNYPQALEFFNKAIKCGLKNSHAYSNRANIYKAIGRNEAALLDYDAAIKCDPKNSEAFYSRAILFESLGQADLAIKDYSLAININPDFVDAYLNLTTLLIGLGQFDAVVRHLTNLTSRNPYILGAWLNLGFAFNAIKEYGAAMECHNQILAVSPGDSKAWVNKGVTFDAMGSMDKAIECYERVIQLNPRDPAPYTNIGFIFHKKKQYAKALSQFEVALSIDDKFVDAWCNKGMTLMELRRPEEARQAFLSAIRVNERHASSHLNLGHLLLGLFEFESGWNEYDWRWHSINNESPYFASTKPLWNGQIGVEKLFVWSEQGIGDQVLYATLLPELKKYAKKIIVSTDKKLIPLLSVAHVDIDFIDKTLPLQNEGFDYQIPIASLPRVLRPKLDSFLNCSKAHLSCNKEVAFSVENLVEARIGSSKQKCGLSWFSGNQKLGGDKSVPIMELTPILALEKYGFIDLQYGDTREARDDVLNQVGIEIHKFYEINNDDDLEGLLALINACDVVVTVSNTTAHLAAALGKQVLLLLPYSAGKFWYWNSYQGSNLWYDNVITFEQENQGDWVAPILKVKSYLQNNG